MVGDSHSRLFEKILFLVSTMVLGESKAEAENPGVDQ